MPERSVNATDYYERLGVDEQASASEIKRAYATTVREFPPERNPEQFQRIREAFETLSDEESRAEYDATSDPAVEEALEKGQTALLAEDYDTARAAFKRALVLQSGAHFIRNLLGVTYLHEEAHAEALEEFEKLTAEVPDNYLYWSHRATAEHGLDRRAEAERHYRKALELEPEEIGAYRGLAELMADAERFDEAEDLLEKGIHADGVVDFEDFSLFFELITLRLRQEDFEGVGDVADRIEGVITEEWQRTRVAYRFATLAQSLVEFQAFDRALALAETSRQLAPDDEEIAAFTESIRRNRTIIDEWERFTKDNNIRQNLRALYAIGLQEYFDQWETEQQRSNALSQVSDLAQMELMTDIVGHGSRSSLADEIERMEALYPHLVDVFTEEYRDSLKQGTGISGTGSAPYVWLTCPHCGNQARAEDNSGQYSCPDCNNNFNYNKAQSKVTETGAGCAGRMGTWIAWSVGAFWLIVMAQSC